MVLIDMMYFSSWEMSYFSPSSTLLSTEGQHHWDTADFETEELTLYDFPEYYTEQEYSSNQKLKKGLIQGKLWMFGT